MTGVVDGVQAHLKVWVEVGSGVPEQCLTCCDQQTSLTHVMPRCWVALAWLCLSAGTPAFSLQQQGVQLYCR